MLAATAIAAFPAMLHATSCSVPPPCARVTPGAVVFIGLVIDADPEVDRKDAKFRPALVQVKEAFQGLPPRTEEVRVFTQGSWLKRGGTYLVDAYKRDDGILEPAICGSTAEVESSYVRDLVEYLRLRQAGKAKTSVGVLVRDAFKALPDVEVTIAGPKRSFTAKTDHNGSAYFESVEPGQYRARVSREYYHLDPKRDNESSVEVVYGGCPSVFITMQAEGGVSGLVRDEQGTPVSSLPLELLGIEDQFASKFSSGGWFQSKTDDKGNFRFESVSPGRYYLGTNLLEYSKTAPIPRIFYPGRRDPTGAIPVEVKLGESLDNLVFSIPYFGKPREIRLLVVDEAGHPVEGASLKNKNGQKDWDIGVLAVEPRTDEKGTLVASGFEGVHYMVGASLPGKEIWDLKSSDYLDVLPGRGSVRLVLILKNVFNRPSAVKP